MGKRGGNLDRTEEKVIATGETRGGDWERSGLELEERSGWELEQRG